MSETVWVIFRDDELRKAEQVVKFVDSCLAEYRKKMGMEPNVLGVTSVFPAEAEAVLVERGMRVVHNLPAWAKSEAWVGREEA